MRQHRDEGSTPAARPGGSARFPSARPATQGGLWAALVLWATACGAPPEPATRAPARAAALVDPFPAPPPSLRPPVDLGPVAPRPGLLDEEPEAPVGLSLEVFAPFACDVSVAGDFNDWTPDVHLLEPVGEGIFRGFVPEAREGDGYKLVIDGHQGERAWKNDPRARALSHSTGHSIVTKPERRDTSSFVPASWNEAIIYEMHIGTFVDEPGGGPGTFDSAITRLDDLAELGVTHLKVMPIAEFAGDFSWGYNPAHPFAVESAYGGIDALRRFLDAAHARGLAVILDVVYNHLGPSDLDLWRFDGWYEGEGGGAYFYNDWRAETPWGHTRPDYGRPQVRDYLVDNALYWLDELGFDGLRVDSTGNIRATLNGGGAELPDGWRFLQELNEAAHALPQWKVMIAEDLGGIGSITLPPSFGGAGFDAQWDARFVHPVRDVLIGGDDNHRSMAALVDALTRRVDGDPFNRVLYTESHDEVANGRSRLPEEIWPGNADSWFSRRRSVLGLTLALTAAGVPMLFQGQEFLEDGWFADTDPLDWQKRDAHADVWRETQGLIALRRNQGGHTRGLTGPHLRVSHVDEFAKTLAYHRWAYGGAGDDVMVVARFRDGGTHSLDLGVPHCGDWQVRLAIGDPGATPLPGGATLQARAESRDGMPCTVSVALGPYGALVLSQDAPAP